MTTTDLPDLSWAPLGREHRLAAPSDRNGRQPSGRVVVSESGGRGLDGCARSQGCGEEELTCLDVLDCGTEADFGGKVSSDSEKLDEVSPTEADELLRSGSYLLDVREIDEWQAGHAPVAHHIALGELEHRYREIPEDSLIICVCRGGGRSARAAEALAGVGYKTVNLAGGMRAWAAAELAMISELGEEAAVI